MTSPATRPISQTHLARDVPTASREDSMRPTRDLVLALATAALLTACTAVVEQHGQRLDPDLLAAIRPGVSSKEEVARLLGSPSAIGTFDDRTWYYVTQRVEKHSFFQNRLAEQRVVAIRFDDRGIVQAIDERGLEEARAVRPAPDKTPTRGSELTIVQQLLGNIGRFNRTPGPVGSNF
jgi:outer membrane protein assembly factor BamE (lipoprotein component of BamABCDE complex)